jgi:hypothetical protein
MIFIHFINGKQVEAIQRNTSPGADWIAAPEDFDWNKRYKLIDNNIVKMTAEDLDLEDMQQYPEIFDGQIEVEDSPQSQSDVESTSQTQSEGE